MDPNQGQEIPQQTMPTSVEQAVAHQALLQQSMEGDGGSRLKKFFFIFLGLIVLLVIAGGSYLLGAKQAVSPVKNAKTTISPSVSTVPTVDPTAGWVTYTDSNYHFSIKVPPDYLSPQTPQMEHTPGEFSTNSLYEVDITPPVRNTQNSTTESYGDGIRIELFSNPQQLSAAEYVNIIAFQHDLPQWTNKNQPRETVRLPSGTGIRIEKLSGGAGRYGPVVFIADKDLMYEIEGMNGSNTIAQVFDKAIETFTLASSGSTPVSSTSIPANWKTYAGNGIGIAYPTTWTVKTRTSPTDATVNFVDMYDPSSLVPCNPNHCSGSLPTKYVNTTVQTTTETAKEFADKLTSSPVYVQEGSVETVVAVNGLVGYMYKEAGEGSQGYDIALDNGKTLVVFNIPYADINADQVTSQILSSFAFAQ